jgi:pre-mRNA-processing factor SLU7
MCRWNGYDAAEYTRVVERYETLDTLHKELKAKERVEELYAGKEGDAVVAAAAAADGGPEEDDAKIQDEEDAGAPGNPCVQG